MECIVNYQRSEFRLVSRLGVHVSARVLWCGGGHYDMTDDGCDHDHKDHQGLPANCYDPLLKQIMAKGRKRQTNLPIRLPVTANVTKGTKIERD